MMLINYIVYNDPVMSEVFFHLREFDFRHEISCITLGKSGEEILYICVALY